MSPFGVTEKIMQDIKPFAKQEQKVLTVTIELQTTQVSILRHRDAIRA